MPKRCKPFCHCHASYVKHKETNNKIWETFQGEIVKLDITVNKLNPSQNTAFHQLKWIQDIYSHKQGKRRRNIKDICCSQPKCPQVMNGSSLGLPWLVSGPISLPWIKGMSLGMIDILFTFSRQILLVFNTIPLGFQQKKLQKNPKILP